MLTESGSVPLPALTKHLSEGGRKAFQPLDSPLSVGMWEQSLNLACWRDGKVGGFFKRDARDKGAARSVSGSSMLSMWPSKPSAFISRTKARSVRAWKKARPNDFILRLEVRFSGFRALKLPKQSIC